MYLRISAVIIALIFLIAILTNIIFPSDTGRRCRCLPHESCWPSTSEWNLFNESINGHLIHLRPVGATCHGAEFNQDICSYVKSQANNSVWRASDPGTALTLHPPSCSEEKLNDYPSYATVHELGKQLGRMRALRHLIIYRRALPPRPRPGIRRPGRIGRGDPNGRPIRETAQPPPRREEYRTR